VQRPTDTLLEVTAIIALVASAVTMWKLTGREYDGRDVNSVGGGVNPRNSISLDR